MALLHSKQLDPNFTGSYNLSGSSQSLISNQVVIGSNLGSAVAHPSASMTVLLGDKKGMMIPSGSSDPSGLGTTEEGMMFYNTDDAILKIFDGTAWIPAGDINTKNTHLTMSADIDNDGSNSTILFRIDGQTDSDVKLRLKSDDVHEMTGSLIVSGNIELIKDDKIYFEADKGTYVESDGTDRMRMVVGGNQMLLLDEDDDRVNIGYGNKLGVGLGNNTTPGTDLEVAGDISASGDISANTLTVGGSVQGDLRVTGDVLAETYIVSSSVTYMTQSFASGSNIFGDTLDDIHEFTGSLNLTGSSSTVSGTLAVTTPLTSSTAIYTNNIQNGYPTSNLWGQSLEGSYFNNFDNTTHVSEILRFIAGAMSHSLDVSDAAPNTKTFASVDTNENNLGSTDSINGYVPTNYTGLSNATLNYLVGKDWASVGSTIFNGISVYHDNGGTYYVDFDSNSGGSTAISSSNDTELFGLGGLDSGAASNFKIRVHATHSFSDTGSISAPTAASNTVTTQSRMDLTVSSFGTTSGLNINKLITAQPAVIPSAYQDGKFTNIGGISQMSGSLSRRYHASNTDWTSLSSSGYYRFHGLTVEIASGSSTTYQSVSGTTKNRFWAPIDTIDSAIGTNTLADVGTAQKPLTATSRSLSGVPYLIDATYEVSTKITGLFNPMYAASTTLVDMTAGSVGVGSVSISGDTISTSGGTIQTSGKVFQSDGTTAVNSGVPRYNDIAIVTGSVTFDSGTGDNINQTGVGDTSFTVATKARNRNSSQSTLDTQTILYHSASNFGHPAASGSLAVYGRAQGYDGGSLTGTSEAFSGEDFRIVLNNNVLSFNGASWTTTYELNQLGNYDLQVKPGFLVDPGGDYRYWFPEDYGSGTYKFYIRRFQTSGTKTSMTVDIGKTLVNWTATTADSAAVAILFKSSASGSGANSALSTARVFDPSDLTSNVIATGVSADNFKNPFSSNIDIYGNTGGSKSSTEYTVPMRNSDGMYLDSNDNEFYVIVRYKGDVSPVTSITISTS